MTKLFSHASSLPRRQAALLLSALILAGCATAPDVPQPDLAVPAAYKELGDPQAALDGRWKPAQPAEAAARGQWWKAFDDPVLDGLQAQAEAASPSLASAAARLRGARAALRQSEAARWPQLNASIGVGRDRPAAIDVPGLTPQPHTAYRAGLDASYEVDLLNRVGKGIDAASADLRVSQASYRSVLLALQADVAQTYFQLRTLDAEISLLDRTLGLRNENLSLVEKRQAAGDVSELDVARGRSELAAVRAESIALRGQRARVEHTLALLLGKAPGGFDMPPLPLAADAAVPSIPPGLPSALLERRPDVAAAQAGMMGATARVGLARTAIFPALMLTASGGYASLELEDLFKWSSRSWLSSLVLSLPVLDGGRNRAAITRAEAALEGAVADYRLAVLSAFADVEDQLASLRAVRGQTEVLDQGVVAARRAAELADKRYRAGEDSYLSWIDAQRALLSSERQAVQLRGAWATSTVGLVRSLGGSWSVN